MQVSISLSYLTMSGKINPTWPLHTMFPFPFSTGEGEPSASNLYAKSSLYLAKTRLSHSCTFFALFTTIPEKFCLDFPEHPSCQS